MQQKNQRMAADRLFHRMVRDKYSFVVYDGQFTHLQVFETVIQIMWTYVVMPNVVEGVSMISEIPDWWLRPGKQKFTVDLNGSITNHGKAIHHVALCA